MESLQEKQPAISETTALTGDDFYAEDGEETVSSLCCGNCFQGFRLRWRRRGGKNNDGGHRYEPYHQQDQEKQESWLIGRVKKVKELSEVVAGPKWKNFIRRFSHHGIQSKKIRKMQFQYDPQSYALNFDDGM
ncbi:uncharacterized protein LOC110807048 [Carica papaya]|uniref:uncharacterized protein LOC110807048 n=1 Tax=Carica papaya TaxID=3649 RepID=UPI000B8D0294|nr:uncharacterized protein LOC110807048 [Carica papaya]